MAGPARQWYLQLSKNVRRSWTDLTEHFRIQYCGKGVFMASRYYHASKHPDEMLLEYLYRLNVAAMRAKIPYAAGTAEERREHVELFINTLGSQEQELASRLTLMEVPNASVLEKKLRARQRGLVHQKKTLFESSKFRQKAPVSPAPPPRAVHAIHATTGGYDSGRESCDSEDLLYDQDRDEDDRAKMFVTGQTPPGEPARREAGSDEAGRDRPRCRHYVKLDRSLGWKPVRDERSVSVYAFVTKKSRDVVSGNSAAPNDNTCESKLVRTTQTGASQVATLRFADEYAREPLLGAIDLQPGERREYWKHYAPQKWFKQAKIHGKLNNRRGVLLLDTGAEVSILDTTFAREIGCLIDTDVTQNCVGIRDETYYTVGRTRVKITLAGNLVYFMDLWVGDLVGQHAILGMNFMVPAGVRIDTADETASLPDEVRIQLIGRRPLYGAKMHPISVASPLRIDPGRSRDIPLRPDRAAPLLWVTRGKAWVTTLVNGRIGRKSYLRVTNIGERRVTLDPPRWAGGRRLSPYLGPSASFSWAPVDTKNGKTGPEMAILPDLSLTAEVKIEDLKVGQPTGVEPEVAAREGERLRQIIWKRRKWLIGKGNALPPAAVGVICDIDVGDAKPVAQRVRKIPPQFKEKAADLINGLLSAVMIQPSTSPWASPIAVIVKKNGVDIRLCIDYRLLNGLTRLMVYPMPLVNDLLEDLDKYLWYCSLDMACGFWVVPMTDRARLISAFITPLGLFEWLRMPFGFCNAPQIYQRLIDNALYGFLRLSPENAARDVFEGGEPERPGTHSVLGRRSYIDDILIGGESWDDLCRKVERLLDVCEQWHLSISVEKSEWGMPQVDYLGHKVSQHGLQANPKSLDSFTTVEFPRALKGLQSFLGSLNYYHRFIPDFAVYATTLYALTESDFGEYETTPGVREQEKWRHALRAFEILKSKLATTPMLKHFDAEREPVVIVYANDWVIAAVLAQVHEDVCTPVKFTTGTLKPNELKYNIVEKEVLALLRALNECFTMLAGRTVRVLTRHTTLAWLFRSKGLHGRLSQWAAVLSPWRLEICRSVKGEEEILRTLAASITPPEFVDAALKEISPRKRPPRTAVIPVPSVASDEELHVMSFDGSAKAKREGGVFSAVVWTLSGWEVARATSGYAMDLTVIEAEYRGLLLGCPFLQGLEVSRLIICGDSNLVIRQMREEMDCKSPGLKLLRQQARNVLETWPRRELFHARRDWNASTDMLAGQALQRQAGLDVISPEEIQSLKTLNRMGEVIHPRTGRPGTFDPERPMTPSADAERTTAVMLPVATRAASAPAAAPRSRTPEALQERVVQRLRLDRIRTAQDKELWIANLKRYLRGELGSLSKREAKDCCKIAPQYEEGESGLLYYRTRGDGSAEDRDAILKLVTRDAPGRLPPPLPTKSGGRPPRHRTNTGKGRPTIRGESPGNIIATYPFQVIAMDHIPSLPVSYKENTERLVWVDLFTGFVIAKANASRSAQTVAEAYEEAFFRRFGAR
ncbi:unnamed protein product [Phytophthora fragariaefolia]|uniref:RNA-directed DNA polymerase n=1 Tax=Phytophthora fragariaefolia TaxID=1490495 RepID=A0A9W6X8U9_9STRA|nr:unnamed protein product [Phytophthora fragariaefolia]